MLLRFIGKLLLFGVPALGVLLAPAALAMHMGEAMPLRTVVAMQAGSQPVLYSPADNDVTFAYKLLSTQARRPEVLVIGSSRVLQFRSRFLNLNSAAFYNAAGQAWGLPEIHELIAHLDAESAPRVMLFGIDQVWFNADYENWEDPMNLSADEIGLARVLATTRKLLDTLIDGDIELSAALDRQEWVRGALGLGLNALQYGRGYRNDGSHQEGDLLNTPELGELAREHDIEVAPAGWRQFVKGNNVSEDMLDDLDAFLRMAHEQGIFVIGFAPPLLPTIYDDLMAGGKHNYLVKSAPLIADVFARYGYPYYDFTDARAVGGADAEMYDGWHPSELLSLRMYIALLRAEPDTLGQYSDLAALEQIAAEADNPLEVFGNTF